MARNGMCRNALHQVQRPPTFHQTRMATRPSASLCKFLTSHFSLLTFPPMPWSHKTLTMLQADLAAAQADEVQKRAAARAADKARWSEKLSPLQREAARDTYRAADRAYFIARRKVLVAQERVRLKQIECAGGPRPCDHTVQKPLHRA